MSVFFDPFRSLTNEPFGQNFGSALLAGGSTGIPGLLSLWNAKTPSTSPVGPQIQTSVAGNQPDASGNMVPWPVNHPGRGGMVQPAYSNLLQNSKFEGAVSGTPGTVPTNWTYSTIGAAALVYSAANTSIQLTATASRCFFAKSVTLAVSTTYRFDFLATCDGVLQLGHIVAHAGIPAGATASYRLDDATVADTAVPAAGAHRIALVIVVVATGGSVQFRVGCGPLVAVTGTVTISQPQLVASVYQMPYAASGAGATTSVTSTAATSGGNGLAIPLSAAMAAALSGGAFTAAALVEMGVSSAQVTAPANILSVNDVAAGLIFADSGGKLKCTDGTNTAEVTVTGGWVRTDELLPVVQCDGATFRIGYAKNTFTTITWGTAVAVGADGDWDVVTHERIGLNSVIPLGVQQVQTWAKAASEAEILRVRGYAV